MKPARGIEQLIEAGYAGRGVSPSLGTATPPALTLTNCKTMLAFKRQSRNVHAINARERRTLPVQNCHERVQSRALEFRKHTIRVIQHKTGNPVQRRQPMQKRPKSNALDSTAKPNANTLLRMTHLKRAKVFCFFFSKKKSLLF
jgi:hypothetical protein